MVRRLDTVVEVYELFMTSDSLDLYLKMVISPDCSKLSP